MMLSLSLTSQTRVSSGRLHGPTHQPMSGAVRESFGHCDGYLWENQPIYYSSS